MKQYIETENGNFTDGQMTIPNEQANRHYQLMTEEVANDEAEIIAFDREAKDKCDALAKIKPVKQTIRETGFKYEGYNINANDKAQANMTALVLSFTTEVFAADKQIPWEVSQGVYYVIDGKDDALLLAGTMAEFVQKCYLVEGQMVEEINADYTIDVAARFQELMNQ